jgi:hypothetical protein
MASLARATRCMFGRPTREQLRSLETVASRFTLFLDTMALALFIGYPKHSEENHRRNGFS